MASNQEVTALYRLVMADKLKQQSLNKLNGWKSIRVIQRNPKCGRKEFKTELAKDIASETSGDFQEVLLALVKGERSEDTRINEEQADNDARPLFETSEKRKGTDNSTFINILTSRSLPGLLKVFRNYASYSKNDVSKATDLELKDDTENCLMSVAKCAASVPVYFAERFHLAMKGSGTKDKDLIILLVSRSEIDLKEIKAHYLHIYGKSLHQAILGEKLNGDYGKIILALCGPDK